ncbi:MAG: hypothetical protein KatS3mg077_1773 [Candidatus Binatia bacterium]|nr:MAG: hypothetical protein KatS3mg077_1773 [Candidatus Binatia bacterium]
MRPGSWLICSVLLCLALRVSANDESPHWMLLPNGEPDEEKCAVCHDEDKNLLSSKEETCLSCHDRTLHSGSAEHLRATAAEVEPLLPSQERHGVEFPLAEDGRMYCGTCHLFHDPRVDEVTLAAPRSLPPAGLAKEIRQAIEKKIQGTVGTQPGAELEWSFAPQSTGFLRLPIDDNRLCTACHEKEGGRR